MAVNRQGRSITMSASGDAIGAGNVFSVSGANFRGTGLTAGQQLKLTDNGGSILFDYLVSAAADNADLLNGRLPQIYNGLTLVGPADGTWLLTLTLE